MTFSDRSAHKVAVKSKKVTVKAPKFNGKEKIISIKKYIGGGDLCSQCKVNTSNIFCCDEVSIARNFLIFNSLIEPFNKNAFFLLLDFEF